MTAAQLIPYLAGLLGSCVGSFLNVCIYRIPLENLSIARPRWSFCPDCEQPIRWYDNIPILAWIWLRGRCRSCRAPISVRYPVVEALTAFLFVLVIVEKWNGSFEPPDLITVAFWALLLAVLVVITYIDIDHRIIPDELSVTGAALAPLCALLLPGVPIASGVPRWLSSLAPGFVSYGTHLWPYIVVVLGGAALGVAGMVVFRKYSRAWDGSRRSWWDTRLAGSVAGLCGVAILATLLWRDWNARPEATALMGSLIGMAVGSGSIYAVGVLGKLAFRKDAMGFGDVKLMALLGAVLGWKGVLLAFFIACLLGSMVGIAVKLLTRSSYMPFGPYLSSGAVIMILWPDHVDAGITWYMNLFPK